MSREEALELEPGLGDEVYAALHVPSSGIVCPFELTLAFAENAYHNGTEFSLNTEVTGIKMLPETEPHTANKPKDADEAAEDIAEARERLR